MRRPLEILRKSPGPGDFAPRLARALAKPKLEVMRWAFKKLKAKVLRWYGRLRIGAGVHFNIEDCEASCGLICLKGWIFSEKEKMRSLTVAIAQDRIEKTYEIHHHLDRYDVFAVLQKENARYSGFFGIIQPADLRGRVKVFLVVEFETKKESIFLGGFTLRALEVGESIRSNRRKHQAAKPPRQNRVALYSSSQGNYFFTEIRDLIAAGFGELGLEVESRSEKDGFAPGVDWHFVVAPHEFFYLGDGVSLERQTWPLNTVLINTEQPSTSWFGLASRCFPRAYAIWDIDWHSSQRLAAQTGCSYYLPLGYVPHFSAFQEVDQLPPHAGTCFLEESVRRGSYLQRPLRDRPIDVLFIGHASDRRRRFFARHARCFSKLRCYLHLPYLSEPVVPGSTTVMDTRTLAGLEQRSKIVLNIHHRADVYFEWHRIVLHGIWQKALVISEPCSAAPPFAPGVDFVVAELDEIPDAIQYHLSTEQGLARAQSMTEHAFATLTQKCRMVDRLPGLLSWLEDPAAVRPLELREYRAGEASARGRSEPE